MPLLPSLCPSRCFHHFSPVAAALAVLVAAASVIALPGTARAQASAQRPVTFEMLYDGGDETMFGSLPFIAGWLPDGQHYLEYGYDNAANAPVLMRVNARTGASKPFYDVGRMQKSLAAQAGIGAASAARLSRGYEYVFDTRKEQVLIEHNKDLYVYRFASGQATRLTSTPKEQETNASFSPDGSAVGFVKKNNLYSCSLAAPGKTRQLTRDGSAKILNGRLDWVYEEELYGRGNTTGYVWSPDSRRIVFLRLDETPVPAAPLVNALEKNGLERQFYPRAGDPNPIATLGIVPANGSALPRIVDVSKYPAADRLIVRFGWSPDSRRVVYQVQNRIQKWLDLNVADAGAGKPVTLLRETSPAWVEAIGNNGENPLWLRDGSFLWLSDRTGYRHLYRYKPGGTLVGAVTKGDWDVLKVHGVDEKANVVCFDSSERSFIARHAYRAPLSGAGKRTRLTEWEGNHETIFSPTLTFFFDTWSRAGEPQQLRLSEGITGKEVRLLADNAELKKSLTTRYKISLPELVQVKARDGFVLEAMIVKPTNFDPRKKYPIVCPVYGGPNGAKVRDAWGGYEFWEYQAWAQKGFIVWVCDNRSASGKGAKSAWTSYRDFGPGELRDMEDGIGYLASQPWADTTRVGIYGWSFGGFLVQYAMTHSTIFKAGVSAAGVSDWRLYDSIYTERYMDTPQRNPEGYSATSPINAVGSLSGKLLLIHGLMDDNVHVQNTLQLSNALQKAGKKFDMMLYSGPQARHGFSDPLLSRHEKRLEIDFLTENL